MRKFTVEAFPDVTGWAPPEDHWHAYDTEKPNWALDADWQVVGHGSSPEDALADYDTRLHDYNRMLEAMP